MTVTWLGHACFLLESGGYRVVLDPYDVETYPELRVCAHAVLCSHEHRDHCFSSAVTLLRDGCAYFPDAPTEQGVKHIRELQKAAKVSPQKAQELYEFIQEHF